MPPRKTPSFSLPGAGADDAAAADGAHERAEFASLPSSVSGEREARADGAAELSAAFGTSGEFDAREMLDAVTALRERLENSRRKLTKARDVNASLIKENAKLESELEEQMTLVARLERRPIRGGASGGGPAVPSAPPGVQLLANDDDVALADFDDELDIVDETGGGGRERGWLGALRSLAKRARRGARKLEARLVRALPITRDVQLLTTRYGASMSVYFSFCAWLELTQLAQLLVMCPLLLKHVVDAAAGSLPASAQYAGLGFTWPVHYSSFTRADGALYSAALAGSVVLVVVSSARKYVAERRAAQYIEVYGLGADRMKFARTVMSGWDLGVDSDIAQWEHQADFADRLRLLVAESERAERIAARSAGERNMLRARRLVGILLSAAFTGASWAAIISLQLNGRAISAGLEGLGTGLSVLADFAVPVAVSAVNVSLPPFAMLVTRFERCVGRGAPRTRSHVAAVPRAACCAPPATRQALRSARRAPTPCAHARVRCRAPAPRPRSWDNPATALRLQVFRLYAGKVLNLLINVAGYGILVASQAAQTPGSLTLGGGLEVSLVEPSTERYGCVENQVGASLLFFVGVEFVVDKAVSIGKALARRYALPRITGAPWSREPFPIAQKVINLIYFQALLWLCLPYFPFVALVGPLALHATFKFDAELLRRAMAKPSEAWSADAVGAFFFRLYFLTLGVALAWVGFFLRASLAHTCGPHVGLADAWSAIEAYLNAIPLLSDIYALLINALLLWVVIAIFWVRGSTRESLTETLQEYADVRVSQLTQQYRMLDARARQQERQLALYKRQALGTKRR